MTEATLTDEHMKNFWTKVDMTSECWVWTGARERSGYGMWSPPTATGFRMSVAHGFAYRHKVGPIPEGLELDHLCKNKSCVRPDHLEPVTHQENVRRAHEHRTHCAQGHERSDETWVPKASGHYYCRSCSRERQRVSAIPDPIDVSSQRDLVMDAIRSQMEQGQTTQEMLSSATGSSQASVSRWLSGKVEMRLSDLLAVVAALGLTLSELESIAAVIEGGAS